VMEALAFSLSPWWWMTPEQKRGKKNRVAKVRCTSQSPWWNRQHHFCGAIPIRGFSSLRHHTLEFPPRDMPQPDLELCIGAG